MREIKFRAWDHKGGNINNPCFMVKPMGLLLRDAPEWLKMLSSEAILMQYIGLKDKTGEEIYEGDILDRESIGLFPITCDETHGYRFMMGADQINRADAIYGKIIGNVYESPELLKVDVRAIL
jgi:hypothetical protein